MIEYNVVGIREAIVTLNKLDKKIVKDLRMDLAIAARPMVAAIRSNIPTSAPIKGFAHNGRTAWPKTAPKISTQLSTGRNRRGLQRSTVRIIIKNAGVEIADMAGRANKVKSSGMSRAYVRGGVIMRHRLNNQGRHMIDALSQTGYGRASRYVYPAVEKYMPTVQANVEKTIMSAIIEGNQELQRRIA